MRVTAVMQSALCLQAVLYRFGVECFSKYIVVAAIGQKQFGVLVKNVFIHDEPHCSLDVSKYLRSGRISFRQ